MANIASKIELTSQIDELKDVKFTIYRMTEARRAGLRKSLSSVNGDTRRISKEMASLDVTKDGSKITELANQLDELFVDIIDPVWIDWGLHSISNLQIDGKEITKEDINDAPSELYREILAAIRKEAGLNEEESKNSPLPTTSGELATVTQ